MKNLFKIAPEGYKIIFYSLLFFLVMYLISLNTNHIWIENISMFTFFLFLCVCYFFRDPIRKIKSNKSDFLAPADGTILSVKKYEDPEIGESTKISIFLSVLNVHRQWVPLNAKVLKTFYNPGTFFGAFMDKASDKNEQTSILFDDYNNNIFRVKQIAGFVARRIVNHMNPDSDVNQGENLGFIKFGSRVEIIVPSNFDINVKKGMKVKGCKTVIGKFN
tara:strand:+ start:505 stop:1161 length:657 start_codon:yes stop_codon:yes gene_type:complete